MKKFLFYYFSFLFFTISLFCSGVIDSQDGFQYLAVARSIYYKHDLTAPPYEYTGGPWVGKNIHMSTDIGKDGKTYSWTGVGYSLAMVPAVALTDIVYKIYNVSPPVHFPLESDWFILWAASFTNAFYAAILGVILFLYFLKLKLNFKQALFLSFVSIFTTNLFTLAKHSFAHMMFATFLVLTFYLLRIYSDTVRRVFLVFSALSYGVLSTIYNQTFLLATIPLITYYVLLIKPKFQSKSLGFILKDAIICFFILLPFLIFYLWLENLRAEVGSGYADPIFFVDYAKYLTSASQFPLIFEGIYGQLLSPGRSIFIYSPVLLLIAIFWYKIKRKVYPELIVFLLFSFSYIILYAKQISFEPDTQKGIGYWAGELSWGPRYLLPLIPFGMLIVGHIYQQLKNKAKNFIVYPLLAIGLFIEIIGITIPYQTKLQGLDKDIYVSGHHYTSFLYMNLLPQFSPIFSFTRQIKNLTKSFPLTLDHGQYNVKLFDGFDFPFNVGLERWRSIEGKGYISFDNTDQNPIKQMSFVLINHPLNNSSSSAQVNFYLNNQTQPIISKTLELGKRSEIEINISSLLKEKNNQLIIDTYFDDPNIEKGHSQLIALLGFYINGQPVNTESLDFPYISPLGPAIEHTQYQNYGGTLNNPWKSWMIHTQIFERTPDFWWIKSLYYWDLPKKFFLVLFIGNIVGIIFFGVKVLKNLTQEENKSIHGFVPSKKSQWNHSTSNHKG